MDKPVIKKEKLYKNLEDLIQRIEAARIRHGEHHIVRLVVVSKYTNVENIGTLYELGQRAFGENQVQQLEERSERLKELPIEWHMLGRLQKNKINKLIDLQPFLMHSLDSMELAEALNKRLEAKNRTLSCLLQINSSKEATKAGFMPEKAEAAYHEISRRFDRIRLRGVMTIGAHSSDRDTIRKSFETTHSIFHKLQLSAGAGICSMGMSGDFELAIECGSNMVRIGSAIFKED